MAGGNIKGITIEFRGDTTKLDSALREINKESAKTQKELTNVNKALKFNPTNIDLWKQKQDLLTQKVKETTERLDALKQAQKKMDDANVDKNSEEYRKLQREIIETESKLKTFKAQLRQVGSVKLRAVGEQFKQVGGKLKSAGQAMRGLSTAAAGVVASMGVLAVKSGQWADNLNTMSKQYGIGTAELQKYAAAAKLVDVDTEAIVKANQKLTRTMASAASGTKSTAEAYDKLGVNLTNSDGSLRDSEAVFNDVISALGKMENETERNALAQKLMGKSAAELNPLILDGGETYKNVSKTLQKYGLDFVDQETLDNANEFNNQLDTIKMIGTVAFQSVGASLAEYLEPAIEKVVDLVGRLAGWFSQLSPQVQTIIGIIAAVVAAIGPLLIIVGTMVTMIGNIITFVGMIGPAVAGAGGAFAALAGPIGIAIAIVAALIAVGVLLYKNWDKIKAKASEIASAVVAKWNALKTKVIAVVSALKTWVTNAFNTIKTKVTTAMTTLKDKITEPFKSAWEKIKAIVDKIKNLFPFTVGKLFKGLKLPKFTIEWSSKKFGPLGTIKYPTGFDLDWFAKGGIFDSPSVIGVGERGSEAVVPLDKFWKTLEGLSGGEVTIVINPPAGTSVQDIAREVERRLINQQKQRRLAWQ